MRVAFLCMELAAYNFCCFRSLLETGNAEILLVHKPPNQDAPYELESLSAMTNVYDRSKYTDKSLRKAVIEFKPDVLYVSGWNDGLYLQIARKIKSQTLTVVGLDSQWHGTLKQKIAAFFSPFYLKRVFNVFWVPGNRQKYFAQKMGYSGKHCWEGLLTCDVEKYIYWGRKGFNERKKSFLYVGRYAPEKGIDILAEAYLNYRQSVSDPWELNCVGAGQTIPNRLKDSTIKLYGFIQPEEMALFMSKHGCLVLPSLYEAWGLVIHEAVASGLPVICSSVCGAAEHLVLNGRNGIIIEPNSVDELCKAMVRIHFLSEEQWSAMSQQSLKQATNFTPEKWVQTLIQGVAEFNSNRQAERN
jgi:glycosyltransferase involved in cell wall biosynthesis